MAKQKGRPKVYDFKIEEIDKHFKDRKSAQWIAKNVYKCEKSTLNKFLWTNGYEYMPGWGWHKKEG